MGKISFLLIFFFVVVLTLVTCEFTEQLTPNHVIVQLVIILISIGGFVYPPEEFIIDFGGSLANFHEVYFYEIRSQFLKFSCMRVFVHWVFMTLLPTVVFGYFVHGTAYMKDMTVPRFPPFFDYPQLFLALFLVSVSGSIIFGYWTVDYKKWKFYQFVKSVPECEAKLDEQIISQQTYKINLSRTLNKTIYLTQEFFVYSSNWSIIVTSLQDVTITVINVSVHPLDTLEDETKQLVTLRFDFQQDYLESMQLAMSVATFQDLRSQARVTILIAEGISIESSREDKFLREFERIVLNDHEIFEYDGVLGACFGCDGNGPQVKLMKSCGDNRRPFLIMRNGEVQNLPPCSSCQCRPYWCVSCMGRVYYASQDKGNVAEYFNGVSQCPFCRRHFCIEDVHPVKVINDQDVLENDPPIPDNEDVLIVGEAH